jgi:hypothetical protein
MLSAVFERRPNEDATMLGGLLTDAASALGWRGDAATAASARSTEAGSQVRRLWGELDLVRDALARLGQAMDCHGPQLVALGRARPPLVA